MKLTTPIFLALTGSAFALPTDTSSAGLLKRDECEDCKKNCREKNKGNGFYVDLCISSDCVVECVFEILDSE
ncbi:hypothetical protein Q7P35_008461 [Cladosporium inversicolor]